MHNGKKRKKKKKSRLTNCQKAVFTPATEPQSRLTLPVLKRLLLSEHVIFITGRVMIKHLHYKAGCR